MGKERIKEPKHPTQKPLAVLEHIITIASNEGDIVFDPFMGVGSTGHAALNLSRKFIGMEIAPAYYHASVNRLEQLQSPPICSDYILASRQDAVKFPAAGERRGGNTAF